MNKKCMTTCLFVNPTSGQHSAERLRLVLERLRAGGIVPEIFQVRTPAEISGYCARINDEDALLLVIVAGGDGTFNAVVNGLNPGRATLAVLPFGTSNVLAAELGICSIDDGVQRIIAGKTKPLSVGVLALEGRSLRFVLMAGIGLDGAVVRGVWPLGKRLLRQGAYALSALQCALAWDRAVFTVSSSAGELTCHSIIICNASRYGGNFILSPASSPFSSGLAAICITGNTRRTYLRCALDLVRGKAETSKNLFRISASSFDIEGRHPIQVDGDFVGYGPVRISELPGFTQIIV